LPAIFARFYLSLSIQFTYLLAKSAWIDKALIWFEGIVGL
jgi:hypothetical protein